MKGQLVKDRRAARAALRELVDGEKQLRCIEDILRRLVRGMDPVPLPGGGESELQLDSARVSALSAALNGHFKLLNKVLPDVRAVELSGEDGVPLQTGSLDRMVLATKLLALMRDATEEGAAPVELEFLE